jgi:hypothetical protein
MDDEQIISKVPKIIHQMWLDKNILNNDEAPIKYYSNGYIQSWKIYNPDYKYILWNQQKVNELLSDKKFIKYKPFFNKLSHIQKCDFSRYMIMSKYGGIYGDLDFRLTNSLDHIIKDVKELMIFFEASEHSIGAADKYGPRLSNSILISETNHFFWEEWINHIIKNYEPNKIVFETTGPPAFTSFINEKNYVKTNPEWFGNKCLFMAFTAHLGMSCDCKEYFEKNILDYINPDTFDVKKSSKSPYNKMIGFTTWRNGAGWNGETTVKKQQFKSKKTIKEYEEYWNPIIEKEKLNKIPDFNGKIPKNKVYKNNSFIFLIIFIIVFLIILIIIIVCVELLKKKKLQNNNDNK